MTNRRKGACFLKTVAIMLVHLSLYLSGAQTQQDNCSTTFQSYYNVSEIDPPTTRILSIPAAAATGVKWSMSIFYATTLPASVIGKLDPYLLLQKTSSGEYLLTVNKQLDIEDIYAKLGIELSTLTVRLVCSQPNYPDEKHEVFVLVNPVNEYFPEFVGSPFSVNVSEKEAVGFMVICLSSKARDLDIRPGTGEIYAYSIEPFDYARYNRNPQDDGMDYFDMADTLTGRVTVAQPLDFEKMLLDNRTVLWLNVTVTDYSGNTNWTTVKITVQDDDDLCPEFYVSSVCVPQPLKYPPCYVTYKAKVLVNTTGDVNNIEPGQIYAHDRDTINNSVMYSLPNSVGDSGVTSHFHINQTTGVLTVVRPFLTPEVYSLTIVAEEVSDRKCTAQATLQVDVYSLTYDPWNTDSTSPASLALSAVTGGDRPGDVDNAAGGGGVGGSGTGGGRSRNRSDNCSDSNNSSEEIAVIGIAILGILVGVLAVALFLTCMKLRKYRLERVGSAGHSSSSKNSLVKDEDMPGSSREHSPDMPHKYLEDSTITPPCDNEVEKISPPMHPPVPDVILGPDVFDGTRVFDLALDDDFFKAPGKIKVPLLTSDVKAHPVEPIFIDDGINSL